MIPRVSRSRRRRRRRGRGRGGGGRGRGRGRRRRHGCGQSCWILLGFAFTLSIIVKASVFVHLSRFLQSSPY